MIKKKDIVLSISNNYELTYNSLEIHKYENHLFNATRNLYLFYERRLKGKKADMKLYDLNSKTFNDFYGFTFKSYIEDTQDFYLAKAYISLLFYLIKNKYIIDFDSTRLIVCENKTQISTILFEMNKSIISETRRSILTVLFNIEWLNINLKLNIHPIMNLIYLQEEHGLQIDAELRKVSQ